MPLDAEPTDGGNVMLVGAEMGGMLFDREPVARVLGTLVARDRARALGRDLYISHFATCSDSAIHRRRG